MNNALKAAKEHSIKLSNDKERLSEKLKIIREDVTGYRADKAEAAAALEQCEKRFIRDEATTSELGAARAKLNETNEKLTVTERLEQLVIDELQKVERDILESLKNINVCRRKLCLAEQSAISTELNQDAEIRAKILESYSAKIIYAGWDNIAWPLFLAAIFTPPTKEETNTAIADFNRKHNLNK